MSPCIKIDHYDNVAVALTSISANEKISIDGITAVQKIIAGHKIALCNIQKGQPILKYGYPIGYASCDIVSGEHVHVHNMQTGLDLSSHYSYTPKFQTIPTACTQTFEGFLRPDGRAAVRNEVWIIPTVGCVNNICRVLALSAHARRPTGVDGVYAFEHPYGCSQMGDDHARTRKLLAALANHPNAAAVLVVSLGCENNTLEDFKKELKSWDKNRVEFMVCQDVENEFELGGQLLQKLVGYAEGFKRQPIPLSKLVIGMKCGGSDGFSGITANPLVGVCSDLLIAQGGSTILTEVPEMFGAEEILLNRCISPEVFNKAVFMLDGFKKYLSDHQQVVYENPSPGNKSGGITTLEDKSLGCVQKSGKSSICDVINYGEQITINGLNLLDSPGNDIVSTTALTAAGAHIVLFTTGRGTPFGAPAPTVKIATNTALAIHKNQWIDFNAGTVIEGEQLSCAAMRLLNYVIELASGQIVSKSEQFGFREIAILKSGVVL